MSNVFDGVPQSTLLELLKQAGSTGGTLPPALYAKLEELSDESPEYQNSDEYFDESQEFKSITRILRQAHESLSSTGGNS